MTDPEGSPGAGPDVVEGGGQTEAPKPVDRKPNVSTETVVAADKVQDRSKARIAVANHDTVVLNSDATRVNFFNLRGEPVVRGGLDLMIADWSQLPPSPTTGEPWKLVRTADEAPEGADNYYALDRLPDALKPAGRALLDDLDAGEFSADIPSESWKINPADSNVSIDVDEDAVLIFEAGTDNYILYVRKDKDGNQVGPGSWVRRDAVDSDISFLPQAVQDRLAQKIEAASEPKVTSVSVLRDNRTVSVTDRSLIVTGVDGAEQHREAVMHVGNNLAVDPAHPEIVYFTSQDANTDSISSIDTSKSPMKVDSVSLPQNFDNIRNLKVDSSGFFITFSSNDKFYILNKQTLEEIDSIEGVYHGTLVESADPALHPRIQGVDAEGHVISYAADFTELRRHMRELEIAASRGAFGKDEQARKEQEEKDQQFPHLRGERDTLVQIVGDRMPGVTALEGFAGERSEVEKYLLDNALLNAADRKYLTEVAERVIKAREQEVAASIATGDIESLRNLLEGDMDVDEHKQAQAKIARLRELRDKQLIADDDLKAAIIEQDEAFVRADVAFKQERFANIQRSAQEVVDEARSKIDALRTTSTMKNWFAEGNLSAMLIELNTLGDELADAEGKIDPTVQEVIIEATRTLRRHYFDRLDGLKKQEGFAGTSPTAVLENRVALFKEDIDDLMKELDGLESRDDVYASPYYTNLLARVEEFRDDVDKEYGIELRRLLGTKVSLYVAEHERKALAGEDKAGRPLVKLGKWEFPVWEYPDEEEEEEKRPKQVALDFDEDKGAGHRMEKGQPVAYGEITVKVTSYKRGKAETVTRRIYEGHPRAAEWHNGGINFMGTEVPATYGSIKTFTEVKADYKDWQKGEKRSTIRKDLKKMQQEIADHYQEQPVVLPGETQPITLREAKERIGELREAGEPVPTMPVTSPDGEITTDRHYRKAEEAPNWEEWETEQERLLNAYGAYATKKHVHILRRIDRIKKEEDVEDEEVRNGYGHVPEWNAGWTLDEQTQDILARMGESFQMQKEDKMGVTMLEGDAGTGKDVAVKIAANLLNRKLFTFDATRWTTEKHLTADVTLENGTVVTVPSILLRGMQTPGAMIYINEFNAMPEQAQIGLHALFDQKRSMTIKTEGGREVTADPDCLFVASMNPGYAGTYTPQEATTSRMDMLKIDYAPLFKGKLPNGKPDKNSGYNPAEALRMARSVTELADFTYDLNLDHNTFVKIWEHRFNGGPDPQLPKALTDEQQYDLDTIHAVVNFAHNLRHAFRKRQDVNKLDSDFTIRQPLTGRELAACAFTLRHMSEDERKAITPVSLAKRMLIRHLVSKISGKHVTEITDAMEKINGWAADYVAA